MNRQQTMAHNRLCRYYHNGRTCPHARCNFIHDQQGPQPFHRQVQPRGLARGSSQMQPRGLARGNNTYGRGAHPARTDRVHELLGRGAGGAGRGGRGGNVAPGRRTAASDSGDPLAMLKSIPSHMWSEQFKERNIFGELWGKLLAQVRGGSSGQPPLDLKQEREILDRSIKLITAAPSSFSLPDFDNMPEVIDGYRNAVTRSSHTIDMVQKFKLNCASVILNFVEKMFDKEWTRAQKDVSEELKECVEIAEGLLSKRVPDHKEMMQKLEDLFDKVEKDFEIKQTASAVNIFKEDRRLARPYGMGNEDVLASDLDEAPAENSFGTFEDWRVPHIWWLTQGELFSARLLPKFLTHKDDSGGVYPSSTEYLTVMRRVMTGMTFEKGYSIISPRCWVKGTGGKGASTKSSSCGCPLVRNSGSRDSRCCCRCDSRFTEFHCRQRLHKSSLCWQCFVTEQDQILANGGTDMYKFSVEDFSSSGKLFLGSMEQWSRNPFSVNWRTTGKLVSPNLVAVIVFGDAERQKRHRGNKDDEDEDPTMGANNRTDEVKQLERGDRIFWGQVVDHPVSKNPGQFRSQEFKQREGGRLCIDMHGVVEPERNHCLDLSEVFTKNAKVCVIDLQTFVPEYISLLKAYEKMAKHKLPFKDGLFLNMCGEERPDLSMCDGLHVAPGEISSSGDSTATSMGSQTAVAAMSLRVPDEDLVRKMVDESKFIPILEIRQHDNLKCQLERDLLSLIHKKKLDKGQLINFTDALKNQVHLTQGPPGTGKSYLGVALVEALITIRRLWIQRNPSVGTPPILVLSYKNHAIDEFLVDLQRSLPSEDYSYGYPKLIRMGKTDEPELHRICERTSFRDSELVVHCEHALRLLNDGLRDSERVVKELKQFPQLREYVEHHMSLPRRERRSDRDGSEACNLATRLVVEALARVVLWRKDDEDSIEELRSQQQEDDSSNSDIGILFPSLNVRGYMQEEEVKKLEAAQGEWEYGLRDRRYRRSSDIVKQNPEWIVDDEAIKLPLLATGSLTDASQWRSVVHHFLCGGMDPAKRCDISSCREMKSKGSNFCESHRCNFEADELSWCVESKAVNLQSGETHPKFCWAHLCPSPECLRPSVGGEDYCEVHSCFYCKKVGQIPARPSTALPPRNTCDIHPLCLVDDCTEVLGNDTVYCDKHKYMWCSFSDPYNPQFWCNGYRLSAEVPFCATHAEMVRQQQLAEEATMRAQAVVKCHGTTTKNKPCKSKSQPGSDYCEAHQHQAPPKILPSAGSTDDRSNAHEPATAVSQVPATPPTVAVSAPSTAVAGMNGPQSEEPAFADAQDSHGGARLLDEESDEEAMLERVRHLREIGGDLDDGNETDMSGSFLSTEGSDSDSDSGTDTSDTSDVSQASESKVEDCGLEKDRKDGSRKQDGADGFDASASTKTILKKLKKRKKQNGNNKQEASADDRDRVDIGKLSRSDPLEWNWQMTLEVRWSSLISFLLEHIKVLERRKKQCKEHMFRWRSALASAKTKERARVFEKKEVIGGTIVGCLNRLDVIRAQKPFAMVVEEASEVMEPYLSALFTDSLQKLEMIGDHYQLQPNASQNYDFVQNNNINISMFERLISAPSGYQVPNGILQIQRRMRANICDLTRDFYRDLVRIEDHASCATKQLAEPAETEHRTLDVFKGREIPGIGSHIFVWTHDGKQTQSKVGVSRANLEEADRVVAVTKFLVDVGVKKTSITVLAPYSGQVRELHDRLKREGLVHFRDRNTSVKVSTVDRYQGDENDICVVSLTVDDQSHTQFVKIQNRMIVLLSRPRLGLIIVANDEYVKTETTKHWKVVFDKLRHPCANDTATELALPAGHNFDGSRIGRRLPLRCPEHPTCIEFAETPQALKKWFCHQMCTSKLPCSHACNLECHWRNPTAHREKCDVVIDSPCSLHPEDISCHVLFSGITATSIDDAVSKYICRIKVDKTLKCGHSIRLGCYNLCAMESGSFPFPECHEPSPTLFPRDCGHALQVTCKQREDYEGRVKKPPNCQEKVPYIPTCGHERRVTCTMRQAYESKSHQFNCPKELDNVMLPRCGHTKNRVKCAEDRRLRAWTGKSCRGTVEEGVQYGVVDAACAEIVVFRRKCGHEENMKCNDAFAYAVGNGPRCDEKMLIRSPYCGHEVEVRCKTRHLFDSIRPVHLGPPLDDLTEDNIPPVPIDMPETKCKALVRLTLTCRHQVRVECRDLSSRHFCQESVDVTSPLCSHTIRVPCRLKKDVLNADVWHASSKPNSRQPVPLESVATFDRVKGEVRELLLKCRSDTMYNLPCGHSQSRPCKHLGNRTTRCLESVESQKKREAAEDLIRRLKSNNTVKAASDPWHEPCKVLVDAPLKCGHTVAVACSRQREATCDKFREVRCWNRQNCKAKTLQLLCPEYSKAFASMEDNQEPRFSCKRAIRFICSAGEHTLRANVCEKGYPDVCSGCLEEFVAKHSAALATARSAYPQDRALAQEQLVESFVATDEMTDLETVLPRVFDRIGGTHCSPKKIKTMIRSIRECAAALGNNWVDLTSSEAASNWVSFSSLKKFWEATITNAVQTARQNDHQFAPQLVPIVFASKAYKAGDQREDRELRHASGFMGEQRHFLSNGQLRLRQLTADNLVALAGERRSAVSVADGWSKGKRRKKRQKNKPAEDSKKNMSCTAFLGLVVAFRVTQSSKVTSESTKLTDLVQVVSARMSNSQNADDLLATPQTAVVALGKVEIALDDSLNKALRNPCFDAVKVKLFSSHEASFSARLPKAVLCDVKTVSGATSDSSSDSGSESDSSDASDIFEAGVFRNLSDTALSAFLTNNTVVCEAEFSLEEVDVGNLVLKAPFKQLSTQLRFLAPKQKTKGLFTGTNYLEKLRQSKFGDNPNAEELEGNPVHCLLLLLEAIEMQLIEQNDAEKEFARFIRCGKHLLLNTPNYKFTPLILLAGLRLDPDRKDQSVREAYAQCISGYAELQKLLTSDEQALVDKVVAATRAPHDSDLTDAAHNPRSSPRHEDPIEAWEELKANEGVSSDAMDKLMNLQGLRKVKQEAVRIFSLSVKLMRMDEEKRKLNVPNLNFVFLGNPGTGKTTVARLLGQILLDTKLRSSADFFETDGQKAKDAGIKEFSKNTESGVCFIDEAYNLDCSVDGEGKKIGNEILVKSENSRDQLTFILAGYEDEMTHRFFSFNEGLRSRFRDIYFEDFDQEELEQIWLNVLENRKWKVFPDDRLVSAKNKAATDTDKLQSRRGRQHAIQATQTSPAHDEYAVALAKVACRRIAKLRGKKGFGNAREVRKQVEAAIGNAMHRDDFDEDDMRLRTEDVLGENPVRCAKLKKELDELDGYIGWNRVKEACQTLVEVVSQNYERELEGKKPLEVFLNRLFLGNPGTGKTTCAKIYAKILKHLNLVSNGEVVLKTAGDIGGSVVGEAKKTTLALMESCQGKVLVLDEAYALNDNLYGKQALDALVEKIQDGGDIAVLLLGYEKEMLKMLRDQNPGLQRRFSPENAFYFDDYNEGELLEILKGVLEKKEVEGSVSFLKAATKKLEILRQSEKNFGNAGSVNTLVKEAILSAQKRKSKRLEACDVSIPGDSGDDDIYAPLRKLRRMDHVIEKLQEIEAIQQEAKEFGEGSQRSGNFIFSGAPGTGKTTVARQLAKILFRIGTLAHAKVKETTGLEMTGQYVGQTKTNVESLLEEARGGVLFIDEAYELGGGSFGKEAVTALVAGMTNEKYRSTCIVLAGYQADMQEMLQTNVGLKSRFEHMIEFPDWDARDCVTHVMETVASGPYSFSDADKPKVEDLLLKGFGKITGLKGWGNARDVVEYLETMRKMRAVRAKRNAKSDGESTDRRLELEDFQAAMEQTVAKRMGSGAQAAQGDYSTGDPFARLDDLYRMQDVKKQLQKLHNMFKAAKMDGKERPKLGHFIFTGNPGTGKTTVARILSDILYDLELISRRHFEETTGRNLTGEYVGQTKKKVEAVLERAKGGVLFIDEAYGMGKGNFGEEALDTLVAGMTNPEYGNLVIVIAGYDREIRQMLTINPGLESRFSHTLEFPDWEVSDCLKLVKKKVAKENYSMDDSCEELFEQMFLQLRPGAGWGNARSVLIIWDACMLERANRVADPDHPRGAERQQLCYEDVLNVKLLKVDRSTAATNKQVSPDEALAYRMELERKNREEATRTTDGPIPTSRGPEQAPQQTAEAAQQNTATAQEEAVEEVPEVTEYVMVPEKMETEEKRRHDYDVQRDPGVTDEDWEELEKAKRKEFRRRMKEANEPLSDSSSDSDSDNDSNSDEYDSELDRIVASDFNQVEAARELQRHKEERKRKEEERQRKMEKLRTVGSCPAGFQWLKISSGYRCAGGSHYVSQETFDKM